MYTYDDLGQLIREDNRALNKSYVWTYDNAGNILSKKTYAFTTGVLGTATSTINNTYGNANWGDQLTKYNGMTITYDDIGNPVLVGEDTYVWEGRKLLSLYDDYEFSNYTYNTDGIRTSKEYGEYDYNGYRHEYTLNGSQIVKEVVYYDDDGSGTYEESYTLIYIYDETGAPIGMKHRTPSYAVGVYDYFFFEKNLQGDIIGIYNSSGVKILSYTYDAWGNFTETYVDGGPTDISIARKNPFRYRGYYYDNHSGLYYLQSRYYNPTWGRFISADGQLNGELLGYNLYAYCENNPVMYSDESGCAPKWWQWTLFGIGVALVAAATVMATIGTGGVGAFGVGALIGSLTVGTGGAVVGGAIGYATEGIDGIVGGALAGFGIGAAIGFVVGGTSSYSSHIRSTVLVDGNRVPVYRGGNSMQLKPNEYKIVPDGTKRGISVNTDPMQVQNFGGAYRVKKIPRGLKIVQKGKNLCHYEIIPNNTLTVNQFQSLLNKVILIKP